MKFRAISLVVLIVFIAVVSSPVLVPTAEAQEISDVKVLMLITDYFGWNYFDAKEIFESWGVNVTTIANSLDLDVPSCTNRPPRGTTADILLNQVENDVVTQFDILFIPAGGQWLSLIQSPRVLEFVQYAHDSGVIVATICIGNKVLARANDIVNGSCVVSYTNTNSDMTDAGATIRYGHLAVTDNRFVTGGTGGGPSGGGYEVAPTAEVCMAAVREALGLSHCSTVNITPTSGAVRTNFTITAEITDLDTELGSISAVNSNISEVNARIYTKHNRTLIDAIELVDDDDDGLFSGEFMGLSSGEYAVDIEIVDTNNTLEIVRDSASFSVGVSFTIDPLTLGIIATSALLAMVVIIAIKKR